MASTITIPYEGKEYTLRYNRESIIKMEKNGFNIANYQAQPLTTTMQLFSGAFLAEHPTVKRGLIDKIYDGMEDTGPLLDALVDMYNEVAERTMANHADPEKNPGWVLNVTP